MSKPSSPAAAGSRLPRVESLTGLRWFAALAVFVFHTDQRAPIPKLHVLAPAGDSGVAFFFVLSGFVLTWSFSPSVGIGTFYWRRFARVWPLLLVATAAAFFALHEVWANVWQDSLLSLALLQAWFPGGKVFGDPVAWTLSCEAFFYLAFPFVIKPILRCRKGALLALALLLLIAEVGYRYYVFRVFGHMDKGERLLAVRLPAYRFVEFLLGVIAAAGLRRGWRPRPGFHGSLVLLGCVVLTVWWCGRQPWGEPGWWNQALAPVFTLLIAGSAARDLQGRRSLLRSRPLVALGEWSYAFYLVHLLVVWGLEGFVVRSRTSDWDNVTTACIWLVLATVASAGCYLLAERPIERWLRGLLGGRGPSAASPAPQAPSHTRPSVALDASGTH